MYNFILSSSSGIDINPLKSILEKYGFNQISDKDVSKHKEIMVFIFTDGIKIPKYLYKIPCIMKNHIDGHEGITDKGYLHENVALMQYLAKTIKYNKFTNYKDKIELKFPWIVRPTKGFAGKGITVISNADELEDAIKKAQEETTLDTPIILSEYQTSIMTFQEKKFHCRIYMLIGLVNDKIVQDVWDRGEIFTSKYKYDPDARDKSRTDTHGKSTIGDIDINDLEPIVGSDNYKKIRDQMKEICMMAMSTIHYSIKNYQESANGYEILAADFLILSDMTPILIEINDSVGFNFNSGGKFTTEFSIQIFDWIDKLFISNCIAANSIL